MNTVRSKRQEFDGELYDAIKRDYSMRRTFEVPLSVAAPEQPKMPEPEPDAFSPIAMWVCFSVGILVILFAAGI